MLFPNEVIIMFIKDDEDDDVDHQCFESKSDFERRKPLTRKVRHAQTMKESTRDAVLVLRVLLRVLFSLQSCSCSSSTTTSTALFLLNNIFLILYSLMTQEKHDDDD